MVSRVSDSKARFPKGWGGGSKYDRDYEVGTDRKVSHSGSASGYIRSRTSKARGFATLMQTCDARKYLGKRLQMTAYVKAEKIRKWAGLWMRVDGAYGTMLTFDNMHDRPIKGTSGWVKHAVVLEVPDESLTISFGALLAGCGRLWVDDFEFEPVTRKVPTTGKSPYHRKARNLNFEE